MKIIIADSDRDFCELLEAQIRTVVPSAQLETVFDGDSLLRQVAQWQPQLILLNLMLPKKDGLSAFHAIRTMPLPAEPAVMVFSGYLTPQMQEELCQLRPCFFTALPCDLQMLALRVQNCCREIACRPVRRQMDPESERCRLLRDLGIAMRCKGFVYMRYGLQLLAERPFDSLYVTKWLYPAIGERYQTTAANVERAIRSAILAAWQREGYLLQQELFRKRPTNSEFFAVTEEFLRQEQRMRKIL